MDQPQRPGTAPSTSSQSRRNRMSPGAAGPLSWAALLWSWALVCALALLALLPASAASQWLSLRAPLAQILAFPLLFGAAGVMMSALAVAALWTAGRRPPPPRAQGVFRIAAGSGLSAALVVSLALALWPAGPPWSPASSPEPQASGGQGRTLRVLTYNTADALTPAQIMAVAVDQRADIVALSETQASSLTREAAASGYTAIEPQESGFAGYLGEIAPTALMIHTELGMFAPGEPVPSSFGTIDVHPVGAGRGAELPRIAAVHTSPPLPSLMGRWRGDLARLMGDYGRAAAQGPLILAGDFNATLRHGPLAARSGLVDTASACQARSGTAPSGTWPASAPSALRSPIDHIFVSADIEVLECSVVRPSGTGSDHLAYAVTLRLP